MSAEPAPLRYVTLPRLDMDFGRIWAGTDLAVEAVPLEDGAAYRRIGVAGLQYYGYGRPGLDGQPMIPKAGDRVQLVREPTNPHDANAIMVIWRNSLVLGHVPRGDAKLLAPTLDAGVLVRSYVTDPGNGKRCWSVSLLLVGPAATVLWEGRRMTEPPDLPSPPVPSTDDDDEIPF